MKKLIFVFLLASFHANAFFVDVVGSSFNTTDPITLGSSQWVDIKINGSVSTSDSIKIYIAHNEGVKQTLLTKIFSKRYFNDFEFTPKNTDGTYRIYFNIPDNYTNGSFSITAFSVGTKGIIGTPNGIKENFLKQEDNIKEVFYYNLNGIKIENPDNYEGVLIQKILYLNGVIKINKLLRSGYKE